MFSLLLSEDEDDCAMGSAFRQSNAKINFKLQL